MTDRTRSRFLVAASVFALAALVALGVVHGGGRPPVAAGDAVPDYAAPSLDGSTVSLQSLRGRVVVLNVWATWCPPCRWEMPALQRLHRALGDEGLAVVAVSVDDPAGGMRPDTEVRAFVEEYGLRFPVLLDPEDRIGDRFGVTGLPTTYIIDREGRVRDKVVGPVEWDEPPMIDRLRRLVDM